MAFNSYEFIFLFLPVSVILYNVLVRAGLFGVAKVGLLVTSLIFYALWDVRAVFLLLGSIGFNYVLGMYLKGKSVRGLLVFGVLVNLLFLGYFKYANFFLESLGFSVGTLRIILPLGISFFTFQQISFIVDMYRGKEDMYGLMNYALYVSFFPKLIAGPIVRHKELAGQFEEKRPVSYENIVKGLLLFVLGLFSKVVIADNLAKWVSPAFDLAQSLTFFEAWAAAAAYTFQLYFDFSGYSEMAMGLALLYNVRLPANFLSPYKAKSITDFWNRWHITLSEFLRDYLYIPLGGSRKGKGRRYVNLVLTMLLGGLWHGAGWTFVIWGGLHGLYLSVTHFFRDLGKRGSGSLVLAEAAAGRERSFGPVAARVGTFGAVLVAWVFFRAQNFGDAFMVLRGMVGLSGIQFGGMTYMPNARYVLMTLVGLFLWVSFGPNTLEIAERFKPSWRWLVFMVVISIVSMLYMNKISTFLYFQF